MKPRLLQSQAPRSPIQILTDMYVAELRKKANHSTSVAIKAGFHSEAVEVIYLPIPLQYDKDTGENTHEPFTRYLTF